MQWHSSTPNSTSHLSRKENFTDGRSSFLCLLFLAAEANASATYRTLGPCVAQVGWVLGELHDTCNDYCRYTGYAGCDFERIVEINRIPRARRLLESLNYTCDVSDGEWNEVPTYRPDVGGCYYNRNALSCDANRGEENQPVCACNGTAPSPTPLALCAASSTLSVIDLPALACIFRVR